MKAQVFCSAMLIVSAAHGSEGHADPRAIEACRASSATFVQVNECLPDAHVAFVVLDRFDDIYPPEAWPLKGKCIELNDANIAGALVCVTQALKAAAELKAAMPEGSSLDDPIFNAAMEDAHRKSLLTEIDTARKMFPERHVWGGTRYIPYR